MFEGFKAGGVLDRSPWCREIWPSLSESCTPDFRYGFPIVLSIKFSLEFLVGNFMFEFNLNFCCEWENLIYF